MTDNKVLVRIEHLTKRYPAGSDTVRGEVLALDDLTLTKSMQGVSLLDPGWTILEIKVQDAMPLWLTAILSECSIRKGSFSKYGEAYRRELMKAQYCA